MKISKLGVAIRHALHVNLAKDPILDQTPVEIHASRDIGEALIIIFGGDCYRLTLEREEGGEGAVEADTTKVLCELNGAALDRFGLDTFASRFMAGAA